MNMLRAHACVPLIVKSVNVSDKNISLRLSALGFKSGAKIKIISELKNKIAVIVSVEERAIILSREILIDTEVEYA